MPWRVDDSVLIEPLGSDLVALAQCHALDASVFPHPSLPAVLAGVAPSVLIARLEAKGPVAGFIASRTKEGMLEIVGVAVESEHRGRGVGRALVRGAIANARSRDLDAVTLHCSTGNLAALELYTTEGFRPARRLHRFYNPARFPDGGDAFVMLLALT
jgi:ribosomal protein S18 acetylase RimI-like enzyme